MLKTYLFKKTKHTQAYNQCFIFTQTSKEITDTAIQCGINFFDTAEVCSHFDLQFFICVHI